MQAEPRTRPGRLAIEGVQDPADSTGQARITAWIAKEDVDATLKFIPWRAMNLRTAMDVLRNPDRIYYGIREDEDGEVYGWWYVGKPIRYMRKDGRSTYPAPEDEVFVAFLNRRYDLFEWRSEKARPGDPYEPMESEGRFEEEKWRKR